MRRFRWANYSGDPNLLTGWYPSRDPDNYEHPDTISTWDFGPDDQHNSETLMSDWSQGDASVVVWVEEDPIDGTRIYLRDYDPIHPERGNFSRNPMDPAGPDATPDSFPNIVCFNTGGGMYGEIRAVATEGFDPSYEVVFDRSPHRPPFEPSMIHQTPDSHPVLSPFVYYEITCGDSSPSYYCIKRDGCSTINGHKVDIGSNELLYRLPLLDPPYYYLIQAVVAAPRFISGNQNLPENVSQTFDFDGKRVSISVNATKPETLYYILPQEIYKNDHYVRLRINGSKGAYLENLKVYQFVRRNQTRRQTYRGISSIKRSDSSLSFSIAPTLFNQVIDIKFQLEREEKVNLAIYDATGKLVKRLVSSSTLEPGIHTLSWNRKDETGKILPTGLYFVRLKTESATLTQKVMLIR